MTTDEMILYLMTNAFDTEIIRRTMKIFLDRPRNKPMCVFCYILYFFSAFFSHAIGYAVAAITVTVIVTGLVVLQYDGGIKRKIFCAAFTLSMMCLCEFIAGTVFVGGFNGLLINLDTPNLRALLAAKLLNFLVILIVGLVRSKDSGRPRAGVEWSAVTLIPISTATLEIVIISSAQSVAAVLLSVAIVLFLNVIVFYLYDKLAENYNNKLELARVEQEKVAYYNQCAAVMKSQEMLRQFRHDMNNQLEMIGVLADNGNTSEIKKQIHDLIAESGTFDILTENITVDGILNYKLNKLKTLNAEIKTDLEIPRQKFMNTRDFTVILGNLLDNVIDALPQLENGRYCFVGLKYDRGCLIIHIKNTFKNTITHKDGRIISSKPDSEQHGIGLRSVSDVVDKYSGHLDISHKDHLFCVKIILFLPDDHGAEEQ